MAKYSICGIDCDICKHKIENGCKGCQASRGKIFWGECDLYKCAVGKELEHCGLCADFPCTMLQEWASKENTERIDNLKRLIPNTAH